MALFSNNILSLSAEGKNDIYLREEGERREGERREGERGEGGREKEGREGERGEGGTFPLSINNSNITLRSHEGKAIIL